MVTKEWGPFWNVFNPEAKVLKSSPARKPPNKTTNKQTKIIIIIIISAVHATAGRWPPKLATCTSILSHSHPLTATNFLDVVFPSPSYSFSFSGCPFLCYLGPPGVAHSGYMSCPLSSHAPHFLSNISVELAILPHSGSCFSPWCLTKMSAYNSCAGGERGGGCQEGHFKVIFLPDFLARLSSRSDNDGCAQFHGVSIKSITGQLLALCDSSRLPENGFGCRWTFRPRLQCAVPGAAILRMMLVLASSG